MYKPIRHMGNEQPDVAASGQSGIVGYGYAKLGDGVLYVKPSISMAYGALAQRQDAMRERAAHIWKVLS